MYVQTREVERSPARPWFLDVEAIGAAAPVVVLILIGTLRKGAFFKPDVVVLPVLCLALALTSPAVLRWLRDHPLPVSLGMAVTAWWLIDAEIWRHDVESWRLAATWVCAAAGYGILRGLPVASRRIVASAVTITGLLLSVAGLFFVATRSTTWTWPDERSLRYQGPLTYPSAIGLYLLVTLLASLEMWRAETASRSARSAQLATSVRAVILLGVIATDSRGALVGLVVLLCFRTVRRQLGPAVVAAVVAAPLLLYGQRDGVRPLLILAALVIALGITAIPQSLSLRVIRCLALPALVVAGWLLATQHHAVSGLDASWAERGHIIRGAFQVFDAHPLFGAGPDPSIPTKTLAGAPGLDAFAHNEPLELLTSIGIVGVLAFAVAVFYAVRALWARRSAIAAPVLATAAAAGLVDFVWHFPSLGLLCGVVAGAGHARPSRSTTE